MRGNAWQITAIVAIILVVVLIVPLVIMGRNHQTLVEETAQAETKRQEAATKAATLEGEVAALKTLIGRPADSVVEAQKQRADAMGIAMPGENDSTRSYHDAFIALLGDLDNARDARRILQGRYDQLDSDYNNALAKHKADIDVRDAEFRRVENLRQAEQRQFQQEKGNNDRQLRDALAQHNAALAREERTRHALTDRANQLETTIIDIRDANTSLAATLQNVRNPNIEHPAGKITAVDQQSGLAYVNLGEADGLMIRTMFSVYHSSIMGMTFRTAPVGEEAVYCSACMRDVARDVSKASVEVTRILGPHLAEVRILEDILTDPIMAGDVVYSPIWKPGQKLRFALTAGMHLPGAGLYSGTEAVRRLIEMNGGVVDCWIEETVPLGEEHLKGKIDDLTNFIVISDKAARGELSPEVALAQDELLAFARNRAIKTISLDDLLGRMHWRNVTPVYDFSSPDFMPNKMRVVPQHQGAVHQSSGVVSQTFTPDNPTARVDAREANPIRTSPGVVSPLFNNAVPPPPNNSGRTSDLFRSRSPLQQE